MLWFHVIGFCEGDFTRMILWALTEICCAIDPSDCVYIIPMLKFYVKMAHDVMSQPFTQRITGE